MNFCWNDTQYCVPKYGADDKLEGKEEVDKEKKPTIKRSSNFLWHLNWYNFDIVLYLKYEMR